jgi:hypothetical protein
MSISAHLKPESGLVGRAFANWLDHAPQGLATRFVVLWFIILYTAFALLSSASTGLSPELLQTYALGQHPAAGYADHAPLAPWMAGAWFSVFPQTEWVFRLLAMVNAAAGLFAIDRIACLYLDGDKRIIALLLVLLTPFYQFAGQEFGANATMLATWPVATLCFLRAFATRDLAWSAGAGAAAALAMLGSCYSIFLVAGCAVAALAHPGRRAFLRSHAPWLGTAAAAIVLIPHLHWLYESGFAGLANAVLQPANALWSDALFLAGGLAALSLVLAVYVIAVRPGRAVLQETLWPADPDGRMLVILLAVPLALTALAAPFGVMRTPSCALPAWFLLPVVLLRPKTAVLTRMAAIRITALVAMATIATLAAAPLLAWRGHHEGTADGREYYRLVEAEVTRAWHLATGQPLRFVTGSPELAAAVSFYSPDHPDTVQVVETGAAGAPVMLDKLARDGFVVICRADDETCVNAAKQQTAGKSNVQFITYSTINRYLGKPGRMGRFLFILAPPESKPVIMLR